MILYFSWYSKSITSQKYCAFESPTFFTVELLNITSLRELFSKPRAQVPTTRQTPSGFLPRRICKKNIEYDSERAPREWKSVYVYTPYLFYNRGKVPHCIDYKTRWQNFVTGKFQNLKNKIIHVFMFLYHYMK